jgi:hypothetical protein
MKKMKLTVILILVTFAVAFCQPDKTFTVPVRLNAGVYIGTDTELHMTWPSGSGSTAWSAITGKPTTLAGYGISDAALANHNHITLYKAIGYVPTWAEITGKPTFATVATSGSYVDLLNKPPEIELQDAISSMNVIVIPKKTTAEIAAMTPTAGSFVYDVTLNVLKIGNGSVFKVLITAN